MGWQLRRTVQPRRRLPAWSRQRPAWGSAFNTTLAGPLVKGQVAGQPLDVFITGDDAAAKATVSQLVEAAGLRAIDAGPLAHAHYLEGLAFLGMKLQFTLGTQFQSAWKLLA